jgi:hypothetical protein
VRLTRFHAVICQEPHRRDECAQDASVRPRHRSPRAGKSGSRGRSQDGQAHRSDELAGRIAADIAVQTRMSSIDRKQYDKIAGAGHHQRAGSRARRPRICRTRWPSRKPRLR